MLSLTFQFPTDELETQAVNELAEYFGYPAQVLIAQDVTDVDGNVTTEEVPTANPQSKVDFCKRQVADMLGAIVKDRIVKKAMQATHDAVNSALNATVIS